MPTVHPQTQKARDLLPLVAAASAENDEIRKLTQPVVKALIDGGSNWVRRTCFHGSLRENLAYTPPR